MLSDSYNSAGIITVSNASLSLRSTFTDAAVHTFNEVYAEPYFPARMGWCANENGIYMLCARGDDLESTRYVSFLTFDPDGIGCHYNIVDGPNSNFAIKPKYDAEGNYFFLQTDTCNTFLNTGIKIRLIVKFPSYAAQNEVRGGAYFMLYSGHDSLAHVDFGLNNGNFNIYCESLGSTSLFSNNFLLDECWHCMDILCPIGGKTSFIFDGVEIRSESYRYTPSFTINNPYLVMQLSPIPESANFSIFSFSVTKYGV